MTPKDSRQNATPGESAGRGVRAGRGGRQAGRSRRWLTRADWSTQAVYLLVLLSAAGIIQWIIEGPAAGSGGVQAGVWGAVALIAAFGVYRARRELYGYFASAKAGIVLLTAILIMTVVGTIILQGVDGAEFRSRYGALAPPLMALHLDDVFHSFPFALLLLLVMVTSITTVLRRRRTMLRWRNVGLLLTHLSIVVILVGALIGAGWGRKGMVHLEIGQVARDFVVDRGRGIERGARLDLPFAVRLDDFTLEHYDPEFKIYTYRQSAGGYELAAADEPVEGRHAGAPGPGSNVEVTVRRVFQRARRLDDWVPAPPSTAVEGITPAARIRVERRNRTIADTWLARPGSDDARLGLPGAAGEIRFAWETPPPEELAGLPAAKDESTLQIETGGRSIAVEEGGTYTLDDGRVLTVESFFPDFSIDTATHEAFSRSERPDNPALVVRIGRGKPAPEGTSRSYLFARADMREMMKSSRHGGGGELVFRYDPEARPVDNTIVVVGATAERIEVAHGRVISRGPIVWGKPFETADGESLRITVDPPLERAIARRDWVEAPDGPEHRAVEIEIRRGTTSTTTMLFADEGDPVRLTTDRLLVYRENPDDVRNYESTVTILDGGQPVLTRLMKVNHPLSYAGYSLYQSNYDPDNPRYSGLEVVYDPGLPLVTLFFWVLMYGALHTVALRNWVPWWERPARREREAARARRESGRREDVEVPA